MSHCADFSIVVEPHSTRAGTDCKYPTTRHSKAKHLPPGLQSTKTLGYEFGRLSRLRVVTVKTDTKSGDCPRTCAVTVPRPPEPWTYSNTQRQKMVTGVESSPRSPPHRAAEWPARHWRMGQQASSPIGHSCLIISPPPPPHASPPGEREREREKKSASPTIFEWHNDSSQSNRPVINRPERAVWKRVQEGWRGRFCQ